MFSVSHMISSSEKMWLYENISPFFISFALQLHSFPPLNVVLPVAKLEDMLVMHCMTNAVLEYQIYLQILSTN